MAKRGVKIKGLGALGADLAAVKKAVESGSERAKKVEIDQLAADIADAAPVDTGRLRDSVVGLSDGVHVGGGSVDYAADVEDERRFIRSTVERSGDRFAERVESEIRKELPS